MIDTPLSIASAEKIEVAEKAATEAAAGNTSSTVKPKARVSPLVLCTPEGTTFAPPIKVKISYDEATVRRAVGARVAVFKWYPQLSIWVEVLHPTPYI